MSTVPYDVSEPVFGRDRPIHSREALKAFGQLRQGHFSHHHLGEVLVASGVITREQLSEALAEQTRHPGERLGTILSNRGWAHHEEVVSALAQLLALPQVDLASFDIDPAVIDRVPARFAREHTVIPLLEGHDHLYVAVSDPTSSELVDLLRFMTGKSIELAIATEEAIHTAISEHYDQDEEREALAEMPAEYPAPESRTRRKQSSAHSDRDDRPIIQLVQNILADAMTRRASDIHLRPREDRLDLLYRIDGTLHTIRALNKRLMPRLVSRIKVLGNMDIAEHRLPQDGRYRLTQHGKTIDLRLSIIPSIRGESVVIRLLDTNFALKDLRSLGYSADDETRLRHILARNQGMFLVTGPTGSGKSTTLYTALTELTRTHRNIITVEDPVEYHLDGLTQIQTKSDIGYTFARALRHILRHDPDIIMVGEMRDEETAKMAVESALTGHLVLSTLHTNSASATLTRMLEIGIEPYLVNAALQGVLAQRLVRKNCPACREPEAVSDEVRSLLGVEPGETFHKSRGCDQCHHTGVKGRAAVYELLTVTPELRELIQPGVSAQLLEKQAVSDGMTPLTHHALSLARQGVIPLSEVYAVRLE
ncbi:type II secretion system protein E [Saccharospirillum salsuginis]|uniref:Type II secretion system protein E n=1 Tax=Saccharospirillum salsuginis TaxID=418750 RepID=A0A918N6J3_9GAMM|nr:type II secretion system protein E [Saccharospirillum salsuginis]